jgi:hypothetical protein
MDARANEAILDEDRILPIDGAVELTTGQVADTLGEQLVPDEEIRVSQRAG